MQKKSLGEILEEMKKNVEHQVVISTTTTTYKGRIKMVFDDFIEFEDRSKVQANLIYLPFSAIESFSQLP